MSELEIFEKLPFGGMNLREMVSNMKKKGKSTAVDFLKKQIAGLKSFGIKLPEDHVVLLLGGANGILRALAIQLIFGEGIPVYGVHYDRPKFQIGYYHVEAIKEFASEKGVDTMWRNKDATDPGVIQEVIKEIRKKYRVVHLINGIAAGATKRYREYGEYYIKDIDVAFHPVLQYPEFTDMSGIRKYGLVKVETASDKDIERTNKFMGTSTLTWVKPLYEAGLLKEGTSVVAFTDYDFEKDDPVYGMGPLAGAKILQRESMEKIRKDYNVKTVRLCYPAMDTTALGAIPGGALMFALSAVILKENNVFKGLKKLAWETLEIFKPGYNDPELRMDTDFQRLLPDFHRKADNLHSEDVPEVFRPLVDLPLP